MSKGKKAEELSTAELEALLEKKKSEEKEKQEREKKDYERKRDKTVTDLATLAKDLSFWLFDFNRNVREAMEKQRNELEKYGKIRANSKGGFQLISANGQFKIVYQYKSISSYDERADKAEALLKDFLGDCIKKKDKEAFNALMALLERNNQGKLEYARVQQLYKLEHQWNDERWVEAIQLFKESFTVTDSKMQIYFHERNDKGEYIPINLNFSSL